MGRVFLLEDETLIRMMIAEMVEELGHRVVAEAGSVESALLFAQTPECDLAILDINIGADSSMPIAEILDQRGVPLIFSSGHGPEALPERFCRYPALRKPFTIDQLGAAIELIFPV